VKERAEAMVRQASQSSNSTDPNLKEKS